MTNAFNQTLRFLRTPRGRRIANVVSLTLSLAVAALAGRWFAQTGFPLAHANLALVAGSAACLLAASGIKAWGWSRLFQAHHRPRTTTLAAAGGAACLAGVALPGRIDDALRLAVVRRFEHSTVGTIALSVFTLGIVDTVAMTPLASTAAASTNTVVLRVGLCIVAAAGLGAAAFFCLLPRLALSARLVRFRLSRWVHAQWPTVGQAARSLAYVLAAWLTRGLALYLLLAALGLHVSFPLAIVFLCAGAAAGALPIAPAGAMTQAGAGASVLLASGVSLADALKFAVAAQLLTVMVGAIVVVAVGANAIVRRRFALAAA